MVKSTNQKTRFYCNSFETVIHEPLSASGEFYVKK